MKNAFLLLTILSLTSFTVFAQNKNSYTTSLKGKTYVLEVVTQMAKDSTATHGFIGHDVVSYEISNSKGLLDAGNLPLPKKQDGKAVRIVDIKITQNETIVLKSNFGVIFKFKLNDKEIVEKI